MVAMVGWLVFLAYWSFVARAWFEQRSYLEVTATVKELRIERGSLGRVSNQCSNRNDRLPHSVLCTYTFEVGGKRYTSDSWNHRYAGEVFCGEEAAQARVAELRAKGTLTAWHHPRQPSIAVRQKEEASGLLFVLAVLVLSGVGLLLLFLRQRRVHRAYQAAFDAWAAGSPGAVSSSGAQGPDSSARL